MQRTYACTVVGCSPMKQTKFASYTSVSTKQCVYTHEMVLQVIDYRRQCFDFVFHNYFKITS
jgi:hypothetical protein